MAITSAVCLERAEEAIREFGDYGYFDKGAWETVDTKAIVRDMADMTAAEVKDLLVTLVKSGRVGEHLCQALLSSLDSRADFDDMFAPELVGLY